MKEETEDKIQLVFCKWKDEEGRWWGVYTINGEIIDCKKSIKIIDKLVPKEIKTT